MSRYIKGYGHELDMLHLAHIHMAMASGNAVYLWIILHCLLPGMLVLANIGSRSCSRERENDGRVCVQIWKECYKSMQAE